MPVSRSIALGIPSIAAACRVPQFGSIFGDPGEFRRRTPLFSDSEIPEMMIFGPVRLRREMRLETPANTATFSGCRRRFLGVILLNSLLAGNLGLGDGFVTDCLHHQSQQIELASLFQIARG